MHRKVAPRRALSAPLWTLHHITTAQRPSSHPAIPVLHGRLAHKARTALHWVRTTTFKAIGRRVVFSLAASSRQPLNAFQRAARKLRKRARIDATTTRQATAYESVPIRLLPMNLAELWAWYRATGRSYAQFKRDHGVN
ncbi:MAG: hypothetical protein WBK08_15355 [Nitrospira sp.]